ncbi:MAG: PASTA domain-containing protein [Candidatus Dormibacteria bacterium]
MTQTVAGLPGYHPTGTLEWVELKGLTLYEWEDAQTPPPTNDFNYPTEEFYLIEMQGRFGPSSTAYKTVSFIAVPTHDSGTPARGVGLFLNGQWVSNKFLSLSRLGQVHYAPVPPVPKLAAGRAPDLVGLSYTEAKSIVQGRGSTLTDTTVAHFDSYLPPFTVVSQTPTVGQPLRHGAVVKVEINM